MFCTLSYDGLHLCEVLSKYLERFLAYGHKYMVEMAIFNICYIEMEVTSKVD